MKKVDNYEQLNEDGFLLIEDFFNKSEVRKLQKSVLDISGQHNLREPINKDFQEKYKSTSFTFVNKHDYHEAFSDVVHSSDLQNIANRVLGEGALFHMSLLQHNIAGGKQGLAWHTDVDFDVGPGKMYNFLIYPFGTNSYNGGLRVVPKSHTLPDMPSGDAYDRQNDEITIYPKAGALLIVDGCCFHAVSANRSSNDRYAINIRYRGADVPESATKIGVYRTGKFDYLTQTESV